MKLIVITLINASHGMIPILSLFPNLVLLIIIQREVGKITGQLFIIYSSSIKGLMLTSSNAVSAKFTFYFSSIKGRTFVNIAITTV